MIWGNWSATADTTCYLDDAIQVVVMGLNVSSAALNASTALLSDAERERASRFAFEADRRRFTVARAGLRRLLGARLGVEAEAVELIYGKNGKPALANGQADSGVRFNLSHSADVAAFAFSTERDIGVDVETIREIPNADNIASGFFSSRELRSYEKLAPIDKSRGFLNCWTRKEAFIKALGDGLSYSLQAFDVTLAPGDNAEILRVEDTPGVDCGWTLHDIPLGSGVVGACVVRTAQRPIPMWPS